MKITPLFLEPVFQERIWGGTQLKEQFGYDIPSNKTGECWAISAHPNGQSTIRNGEWRGKRLGDLWVKQPELFGHVQTKVFPLLTKILDANEDLSVQVHPDDQYAQIHENEELGKTECWYIIDCDEGAELIYGHTAKNKDELRSMIQNGEWGELLRKIKIKPGDFFYVPSGTVHALKKGTLVLETQQSSDTTYRVYDYDRRDDQGNLRDLHIEKSIDVTLVPHQDVSFDIKSETINDLVMTTYVQSPFFSVSQWALEGKANLSQDKKFLLVSVIDGKGQIERDKDTYPFVKGDHFILPFGFGDFSLEGNAKLIISHL